MSQTLRIADRLRQIRKRLTNSASPNLDARLLVRQVLGCGEAALILREQSELSAEQWSALEALVRRRSCGEPMAYITGRQAFWDLQLQVGEGVLVPRADTETLVETALGLPHNDRTWRVAELGTGSGAIALALARERPQWQLLATDTSVQALLVARQNAQEYTLGNIRFCRSNWCRALRPASLDLLLSNPPYIAENDPHLAGDGVRFEPRQALVAGPDGLDAIRIIVASARACLRPDGWLLLEHGAEQADAVCDYLLTQTFTKIQTMADLAGNHRVSLGQKN